MNNSINTVVEAEPNSCRDAAQWLGKLYGGVHEIGTGLHKTESNSESVWKGEAGDAFRDLASGNAGDADQVTEFVNRTKIALEKFADAIVTVERRIEQARRVARNGGLTVTATAIEAPQKPNVELYSPGPGADNLGHNDRTPEEHRILAAYQAKCDVWGEVFETVRSARDEEKSAHEALTSAIDMNKSLGDYLMPKGWAWAPLFTGAYSGAHVTAKALTEAAATSQAKADGALAVLADESLSAADRQKVLSNQVMWAGKVKAAETSAKSAKNLDTKIPGKSWVKAGAGLSVKGVGVLSAGITAWSTINEIDSGVRADKAVTKGVSQVGTGAAVGAFLTAAAGAGYISGVVASGGTLLIGTAAVAGVGYYVDKTFYD